MAGPLLWRELPQTACSVRTYTFGIVIKLPCPRTNHLSVSNDKAADLPHFGVEIVEGSVSVRGR